MNVDQLRPKKMGYRYVWSLCYHNGHHLTCRRLYLCVCTYIYLNHQPPPPFVKECYSDLHVWYNVRGLLRDSNVAKDGVFTVGECSVAKSSRCTIEESSTAEDGVSTVGESIAEDGVCTVGESSIAEDGVSTIGESSVAKDG